MPRADGTREKNRSPGWSSSGTCSSKSRPTPKPRRRASPHATSEYLSAAGEFKRRCQYSMTRAAKPYAVPRLVYECLTRSINRCPISCPRTNFGSCSKGNASRLLGCACHGAVRCDRQRDHPPRRRRLKGRDPCRPAQNGFSCPTPGRYRGLMPCNASSARARVSRTPSTLRLPARWRRWSTGRLAFRCGQDRCAGPRSVPWMSD
jgi:hypothetical protein